MALTRKEKVQAEIIKAKDKLAEQQAKIKELESKHNELENMEIVDVVRGLNIPLDNLAEVLQSLRNNPIAKPNQPSSKQAKPTQEITEKKEDETE